MCPGTGIRLGTEFVDKMMLIIVDLVKRMDNPSFL